MKIVFCALYTTVNQLGAKASAIQDRDVTKNLIEIVSVMCDPLIMRYIVLVLTSWNISAVATAIEVYDDRGRMAKVPICTNG